MRQILLLISLFASVHVLPQQIEINITDENIAVDGVLSESVWKTKQPFDFVEYKPNSGAIDSLTSMYLTFDEKNLYVAFKAIEPQSEKIIGRSLLRDKWYGDDYVSFHIDPNNSDENGFIFSVFPEGSRFDMAVSNDAVPLGNSTFNRSYDMIWEAKTKITKDGWIAEIKIPISNLRFKANAEGNIIAGISGLRSQNHLNKSTTFPEVSQEITNAIEKPSLKKTVIFKGLKTSKQLQVTPYVTASLGDSYRISNDESKYIKNNNDELDTGLDVRYGISPSLTLDMTLNTDFSQVEIDDQIVNVNDRINIFLPEKRKFFQEQAGLFDFNIGILSQLFYSRQIGINDGQLTPIIGGARLTGKIDNTDIGFLSLQTEGVRLNDNTVIPTENFSVLRLRRKLINSKSFIGFMSTNRIRNGYFNSAIGIDNVISLPKDLFLISSLSTTFDTETDHYNFIENSRLSLLIDKRRESGFFYRAAYEYSGDDFNPEMGFLLREKHHNFYGSLSRGNFNTKQDDKLFQRTRITFINSDLYMDTDFSEVITWYNRSFWSGSLFSGDSFSAFGQIQYENVDETIVFDDDLFVPEGNYTFHYFGVSYRPGVQYKIQVPLGIEYGTFFDGTNFRFNINPEFNLGKHLNIQTSYRANRIEFSNRQQEDWIHVAQAKINWAFNLHLSGSIIAQYNSIIDKVFSSARLRYNFSDGHDIYLVYNKDYNIDRYLYTPQLPTYNNQILTLKYVYTLSKF